jgi:phosphatidylglycerophosphate synthase
MNRRQLKTREQAWPRKLARALAAARLTPNAVSVLGIAFAFGALFCLTEAGEPFMWKPWVFLVIAAVCIQLRLLCNMLDGLLAIEGGLKTKNGELFNEVPDRIADIAILLGAGVAVRELPWGLTLGWATALAAVLTAYIRLLGGSFGFAQDFSGPMAKQHRMFAVTVGCLAAAVEHPMRHTLWSLYIALWVVFLGAVFTLLRRTIRLDRQLETR